jgi:hypothetical protein
VTEDEFKEARDRLREFDGSVGDFVMTWNRTENMMRQLLLLLCGYSQPTYVLTAELSALALVQAIEAIVTDTDHPLRDPILHATEFFDRLRVYRNYYAHGIYSAIYEEKRAYGLVEMVSGRGRFAHTQDRISVEQLEEAKGWMIALISLLFELSNHLEARPGTQLDPIRPLSDLPTRLDKPKRYPFSIDNLTQG